MRVKKTTEVIVCNVCGEELKGSEAKEIRILVGDEEYHAFHLCYDHWSPLCDQLTMIQTSTGSANDE